MDNIADIYNNMENAISFGEYDMAIMFATRLDKIFENNYYVPYVIRKFEEKQEFVRKMKK